MNLTLASEQDMDKLGAWLFHHIPYQSIVYLSGNLGAGKTTLVRGYIKAAGFAGAVKSPTYNLVEEYKIGNLNILHFDLYRLTDPEELEWMGIRDYFEDFTACFIEWPEMGKGLLPDADINIDIAIQNQHRSLSLSVSKRKGFVLPAYSTS